MPLLFIFIHFCIFFVQPGLAGLEWGVNIYIYIYAFILIFILVCILCEGEGILNRTEWADVQRNSMRMQSTGGKLGLSTNPSSVCFPSFLLFSPFSFFLSSSYLICLCLCLPLSILSVFIFSTVFFIFVFVVSE